MASGATTITLRLADLDEFRLLVVELQALVDDMRVGASPFADRLEHALYRFLDDPDPDDPEGAA